MILRNKGKPVSVKLAGGQEVVAAMTQHGEVMLPDNATKTRWDGSYRYQELQKSLGCK
jgi:hypothetical protein